MTDATRTESVECLRSEATWYSKSHPDRCVKELWIGGFAIYERVGDEGIHRGVCSGTGAYQWLSGLPLDQITERYTVPSVTVEPGSDQ